MDINFYINTCNIKFYEKSHYYHANCPFCEKRGKTPDRKKKLYLYKNTKFLICYRCGYRDIVSFDFPNSLNFALQGAAFGETDETDSKELALGDLNFIDEEYFFGRFSENFSAEAVAYLSKRKIAPHVVRYYEIREDIVSKAIVFPVRDENANLVSYVLRSYSESSNWRYKYPYAFKKSNYVYNIFRVNSEKEKPVKSVVLCEGIISAISAVSLGNSEQVIPIATFGKQISDTQIQKIFSKGVETIYLAYEWDDISNVLKTAMRLSDFFKVHVCKMPILVKDGATDILFGDPNDVDSFDYRDSFPFTTKDECEFYIRFFISKKKFFLP